MGCGPRLAALALCGVTVSACAGRAAAPAPDAAEPQPLTVTSVIGPDEFRFEPARLTIRANVPVRLTFDNRTGALPYDFTIDRDGPAWWARLAGPRVQVRVAPESAARGEFVLPPGTFTYYCSVYQHRQDGMEGTLVAR